MVYNLASSLTNEINSHNRTKHSEKPLVSADPTTSTQTACVLDERNGRKQKPRLWIISLIPDRRAGVQQKHPSSTAVQQPRVLARVYRVRIARWCLGRVGGWWFVSSLVRSGRAVGKRIYTQGHYRRCRNHCACQLMDVLINKYWMVGLMAMDGRNLKWVAYIKKKNENQ